MLKQEIIDKVIKVLEKEYFRLDDQGMYCYEIYADYREHFEESTIKKIMDSDNPREAFNDQFGDYDTEYYFELLSTLEKKLEEDYFENNDEIVDWINENVYFQVPYNHYENQKVLVNIIADTGDGNYDYTCNNFLNYWASASPKVEKESSIRWLFKQQGYTVWDLKRLIKGEYDENDKFLDSVLSEFINATSSMNALTFSVKMTLGDVIDYLENPKDITLSKDTNCGLMDFWHGGGSLLGIELKKDVKIPKKFVRLAIDGCVGYGIRNVYGMMSDHWKDTLIA